MNEATYIHLAVTRYWIDNPADRDIPFIGLSEVAQARVRSIAILLKLEDERRNLQKVLRYGPVRAAVLI